MTAEHNHAPRCCCEPGWVDQPDSPCPACPKHGELAPAIECPQCHQPIGRPHTDFCTLAPDRVWPDPTPKPVDELVGQLRDAVDRARERRAHERDHEVEDNKGVTWHQTGPDDAHERWRCDPAKCGWAPAP